MSRVILTTALALVVVHAGCQPSKFSGSTAARKTQTDPGKDPSKKTGDEDANPKGTVTEDFQLDKTMGGVDMVWLIDTSGSMREEAVQVQRNFSNFASTLASRSGTKFALIANRSGSGIGVDLGSTSGDSTQVEVGVGSTNALAIAAAAVCPASTSTSAGTICGQTIGSVENAGAITMASGRLNGFFRADAKPVFVVVTDDNARGVTDQNFISLVQPHLNNKTPTVYAFRGSVSRAGCSIAKQGTAYENLATSTGGTVFDICEADWSPNFSTLGQAVIELIKSSFDLKKSAKRVISVEIDGRPLSTSDYEVNGQTITLKKGAVASDATKLQVKYESGSSR